MDVSERKWIPGEKKKGVLENVITQLTLWAAPYLYTTNHIPVSFFNSNVWVDFSAHESEG